KAKEIVFPDDTLLCFGSDEELDSLRTEINQIPSDESHVRGSLQYTLRQLDVSVDSPLVGKSIKQSGIREEFDTMVVGVERDGNRVQNPSSEFVLRAGDFLWV